MLTLSDLAQHPGLPAEFGPAVHELPRDLREHPFAFAQVTSVETRNGSARQDRAVLLGPGVLLEFSYIVQDGAVLDARAPFVAGVLDQILFDVTCPADERYVPGPEREAATWGARLVIRSPGGAGLCREAVGAHVAQGLPVAQVTWTFGGVAELLPLVGRQPEARAVGF